MVSAGKHDLRVSPAGRNVAETYLRTSDVLISHA